MQISYPISMKHSRHNQTQRNDGGGKYEDDMQLLDPHSNESRCVNLGQQDRYLSLKAGSSLAFKGHGFDLINTRMYDNRILID